MSSEGAGLWAQSRAITSPKGAKAEQGHLSQERAIDPGQERTLVCTGWQPQWYLEKTLDSLSALEDHTDRLC